MKRIYHTFSRLILTLLIGAFTLGLSVEYASLEELIVESQSIIYGKVKSSWSQWEDKNIYTYSTIEILDDIRGNHNSKNEIIVKQLGGTVGEIGQEINGSPKLKQDSEVFLFLVHWKDNYWIHSIILGYYEVLEANGEKFAINDFNNVHIIDPQSKKPVHIEDIKTSYNLNSLISEVKSNIEKEG